MQTIISDQQNLGTCSYHKFLYWLKQLVGLFMCLSYAQYSTAYQVGGDNLIDWQFDQTPYANFYDGNGLVILDTDQVVLPYDTSLLNIIDEVLPSLADLNETKPEFISAQQGLHLTLNANLNDIEIFPITESADYKNSIAYFWYNANAIPTAPTQINEKVLYPNFTLAGNGALLTGFHKTNLQTLPPSITETSLGFSLIQNGFSYSDGVRRNIDTDLIFFSISELNVESNPDEKLHHIFVFDPVSELILVGFEDVLRNHHNTDHDFNDAIFAIKVNPISSIDLTNIPHLFDCNDPLNTEDIQLYCQSSNNNGNNNGGGNGNNNGDHNGSNHIVVNNVYNFYSPPVNYNNDGSHCHGEDCYNDTGSHDCNICTGSSSDSNCSTQIPTVDGDADRDGLSDTMECPLLTACPDHDNDGLADFLDLDSDDNGILDAKELTPHYDTDSDGILDYADKDDDNDSVNDVDEYQTSTLAWSEDIDCDGIPDIKDPINNSYCTPNGFENAQFNDSDNDGLSDNLEFGAGPWAQDTDNDLIPNYMDTDSDNDQYSDDIEADGLEQLTPFGYGIATDTPLDLNQNGKADVLEPSLHSLAMNDEGQRYIVGSSHDTGGSGGGSGPSTEDTNDTVKTSTSGHGAGSTSVYLLLGFIVLLLMRHTTIQLNSVYLCLILLSLQVSSSFAENACYTQDVINRTSACWYVGAGLGISQLSPDTEGTDWLIEEDASEGFLLGVGYQFHEKWAVELNYFDLGSANIKTSGLNPLTAAVEYKAIMASAHYNVYQSDTIQLGVLVGMTDLMTEADNLNIEDQNSISVSLGALVSYHINDAWFARLSAYSLDADSKHLNLSINRFLGKAKKAAAPIVAKVDDKDGDGVLDADDICPNTPKGKSVKEDGCHHEKLNIKQLYFPARSAELTPESRASINKLVDRLRKFPPSTIIVMAHTDNVGSDAYNQQLSQSRADSITKFLQSQNLPHTFIAQGKGENEPIGNNNTNEGRAMNRRVELEVVN